MKDWLRRRRSLLAGILVLRCVTAARDTQPGDLTAAGSDQPRSPRTLSQTALVVRFRDVLQQVLLLFSDFSIITSCRTLVLLAILLLTFPILSIGLREAALMIVCGLAGLAYGSATKAHARQTLGLVELEHYNHITEAHRRADLRLNHIIKGRCGGAAALLSTLIDRQDAASERGGVVEAERWEKLHQVNQMLTQATDWCQRREVFSRLEEGSYVSNWEVVNLQAELQRTLGPSAHVEADESVLVDQTILRLVVQEISSLMYPSLREDIRVEAGLRMEAGCAVERLRISMSYVGRPFASHLPTARYKRQIGNDVGDSAPRACYGFSNDLGFSSIKLAITSIGGYVQMAIEEPRTIVHIVLPASRCTANKEQMRSQEQGSGEVLQPALKEKIPGKVVVQGYRAGSPLSSGTILPITAPQTGGTTKLAVRTRRQRSPQKPTELPPPVCIGIDDSPNLRRVQAAIFRTFVKSDEARSGSVGACAKEVEAFVDIVMGKRTLSLEPANLSPADIVVLDENIDVEMDEDTADVKGSQLAKELRGRGFSGIVCILSGSSNEALRELATLPWVDFVFDKSTDAKSIGEALRAGYEANFGHSRLFQPPLRCQDKADV